MGGSSSIVVGNNSDVILKARVAQQQVIITEIDTSAGIGGGVGSFKIDASLKAKFDHKLDVSGFARIGPKEVLSYDLPKGKTTQVYVSVATADDPTPLVICFNFSPPRGKSVVVTKNLTAQVVDEQSRITMFGQESEMYDEDGNVIPGSGGEPVEEIEWVAADGETYTEGMALKVIKMSD